MQDEQRAAWLALRVPAQDTPTEPAPERDRELAELAALSDALDGLGSRMALFERAADGFDERFARDLGARLRAAHPAVARVAPSAPPAAAPGAVCRSFIREVSAALRTHLRVVRALLLALIVAIVAGVLLLLNARGISQPLLTGAPAHTPLARQSARPAPPSGARALPPLPRATSPSGSAHSPIGIAQLAHPVPSVAGTAPVRIESLTMSPLASISPSFYRLPGRMPASLRAPGYRVRYRSLSPADARSLAARFGGLRVSAPPKRAAGGLLTFASGAQRLTVDLGSGEVRFTAPRTAVRGALSASAVRESARRWLIGHGLSPAPGEPAIDWRATIVSSLSASGVRRVSFAPRLPLPLLGGAVASLTVDLDGAGRVVAAHRLWPRLSPIGAGRPRDLFAAIAVRGGTVLTVPTAASAAPAAGALFAVASIAAVYVPLGHAPAASLQPAYLLRGTLRQPGGAPRPYSETLIAVR